MPGWLIVVPAYGRQYTTNEAMRADWDAGKDFRIKDGPYMSRRDIDKNTANVRSEYVGVQIVQTKRFYELSDGRLMRIPFLTEEITW